MFAVCYHPVELLTVPNGKTLTQETARAEEKGYSGIPVRHIGACHEER
jgi:hypothetical protein